jgi:hypothetical protein
VHMEKGWMIMVTRLEKKKKKIRAEILLFRNSRTWLVRSHCSLFWKFDCLSVSCKIAQSLLCWSNPETHVNPLGCLLHYSRGSTSWKSFRDLWVSNSINQRRGKKGLDQLQNSPSASQLVPWNYQQRINPESE